MNGGAKHLLMDLQGNTALRIAENQGNRIIVGFLRQLNADGHVRISDDEMTPEEKAEKALRERVDAAFNAPVSDLQRKEQRSVNTYAAAAKAKEELYQHKLALNLIERRDAAERQQKAAERGEL